MCHTIAMDGNYYTTLDETKTVNALRKLERDHARTVGYYEPITIILDHLAFSPKLGEGFTQHETGWE
jgi:hypothetical protein